MMSLIFSCIYEHRCNMWPSRLLYQAHLVLISVFVNTCTFDSYSTTLRGHMLHN